MKNNQNPPMLPANKDSFKSLLEKLKPLLSSGSTPEAIVRAILVNWTTKVTPHLPPPPLLEAELVSNSAVIEFGNWLQNGSGILVGSFWLSSAFAALLDKEL